MEYLFSLKMCNLYHRFYVIPGIFLNCEDKNWKTEFMKFAAAYNDDMPNFCLIHAELNLRKTS